MGQLSDALESAGRQLEARFRAHRAQWLAEGLGSVLPQSWRFETESEVAVLRLEKDGRVTVGADVIEAPAVLVRWTHDDLVRALLSGRSNEQPRSPPPTIRFTSDHGRKAFSLLGTSLGL
jgi:hypothetical protein